MENNPFNSRAINIKEEGKESNFNPVYNSLENPNTIIKHIEDLQESSIHNLEFEKNAFPVDVFPKAVQEIITATNESLKFSIDYMGASLLYAISVAIGNTYSAEIKNYWQESAVLYIAIVGLQGVNKSQPLTFALKPLQYRDELHYQKYLKEKSEYDSNISLSKKERNDFGIEEPIKPALQQHIVTDFTPESLAEVLKYNKRGLGVYADELASWFKNFNRYNKGSEEQFWLSVWSGKPIRINRKSSDPTFVRLPYISVGGTIQPSVLNELAKDRTENGFLARILFVMPNDIEKQYWSEAELDPSIVENWNNIILNILSLSLSMDETQNPEPIILKFTNEAKKCLFDWQREITDICNEQKDYALRGIYAKIEIYVIRFALCLEMMHYACNESDLNNIGIESARGAIKLAEYFKESALKVYSIISNINPFDRLPKDRQAFYVALPISFTTDQGVKIAIEAGMPERTFKNFISNSDLFHNVKRGHYEKRF